MSTAPSNDVDKAKNAYAEIVKVKLSLEQDVKTYNDTISYVEFNSPEDMSIESFLIDPIVPYEDTSDKTAIEMMTLDTTSLYDKAKAESVLGVLYSKIKGGERQYMTTLTKTHGLFLTLVGEVGGLKRGPNSANRDDIRKQTGANYFADDCHFFSRRRIHRDEVLSLNKNDLSDANSAALIAFEGVVPFSGFTGNLPRSSITDLTNGLIHTDQEQNYSCEWTGFFAPQTSGDYQFNIYGDDACYMWIGDKALTIYTFNKDTSGKDSLGRPDCTAGGLHGIVHGGNRPIKLNAGTFHFVRVMFGQNCCGANFGIQVMYNNGSGPLRPMSDFTNVFVSLTDSANKPYEPVQLLYGLYETSTSTSGQQSMQVTKYDANNNAKYNEAVRRARSNEPLAYRDTVILGASGTQTNTASGHQLAFNQTTGNLNLSMVGGATQQYNSLQQNIESPSKYVDQLAEHASKDPLFWAHRLEVWDNILKISFVDCNANTGCTYIPYHDLFKDIGFALPDDIVPCNKWISIFDDSVNQSLQRRDAIWKWLDILFYKDILVSRPSKSSFYYNIEGQKPYLINNAGRGTNGKNSYKILVTRAGLVVRTPYVPECIKGKDTFNRTRKNGNENNIQILNWVHNGKHKASDGKQGKLFMTNSVDKTLDYISWDNSIVNWKDSYTTFSGARIPDNMQGVSATSNDECKDICTDTDGCSWAIHDKDSSACYTNDDYRMNYQGYNFGDSTGTLSIRDHDINSNCMYSPINSDAIPSDPKYAGYAVNMDSSKVGVKKISSIVTEVSDNNPDGSKKADGLVGFDVSDDGNTAIICYMYSFTKIAYKSNSKWTKLSQLYIDEDIANHWPNYRRMMGICGSSTFDVIFFIQDSIVYYVTKATNGELIPYGKPKKLSNIQCTSITCTKDGKTVLAVCRIGGVHISSKNATGYSDFTQVMTKNDKIDSPRQLRCVSISRNNRVCVSFDDHMANNVFWFDLTSGTAGPVTQIAIDDAAMKTNPITPYSIQITRDGKYIFVSSGYLNPNTNNWGNTEFILMFNPSANNYTTLITKPTYSQKTDSYASYILSFDESKVYKAGYPYNDIVSTTVSFNNPVTPDANGACQPKVVSKSNILNVPYSNAQIAAAPDNDSFSNMSYSLYNTMEGFNNIPNTTFSPTTTSSYNTNAVQTEITMTGSSVSTPAGQSAAYATRISLENARLGGTDLNTNSSVADMLRLYDEQVIGPNNTNYNTLLASRANVYNKYFANNQMLNNLDAAWQNQPNNDAIDNSGNLYYKFDANNPSPNVRDAQLADTKDTLTQYNSLYIMGVITAATCLVAGIAMGSR